MPFDLSPCAQSSRTDLGHNAYEVRHCPQCAGAYAVCTVCPRLGALCPGCRHRTVLAPIVAGEVVCPETLGGPGVGQPAMAVGGGCPDPAVAQAGELAHVDQTGHDPLRNLPGISDQAVMLDAGGMAVYSARGERPNSPDSPA